jgi:hypothetical protein
MHKEWEKRRIPKPWGDKKVDDSQVSCRQTDTGWKIQIFLQFSVKNLVCFPSIFSQKLGGKPKTFSPLCWFEVKNSKES